MNQLEYGPARGEAQLDAYGRIACEAFAIQPEFIPPYYDQVGRDNIRLVCERGEVVGGLALIRKGHYFGGRAAPAVGVALVATAAHRRGGGIATTLLREMLREQRAAGRAISTLYPASVKLYRRAGYELAGIACEAELETAAIDVRDRALPIRPATDADEPAIQAVYRTWAARQAGAIERGPFHWRRVHMFRGQKTRGYVAVRGDAVEGYAFLREVSTAVLWVSDLVIQDIAYATPAAARALLTFIADHRTTRRVLRFRTGPADPLLMMLGEAPYKLNHKLPWMLRLLDVPAALAARGYPKGLNAELHLDVRDDFLPEAGGRFVLRVVDGSATAEAGGRGDLMVDVRALAPLYTGYLAPAELAMIGGLTGPAAAIDTAAGIFAGPTPWLRDEF